MKDKLAKAMVNPRRQRSQYSCMATSMAMCLTANGVDTNEDEVNRTMGARPMQGASWEQALACAQHYGMRATLIVPATLAQVKAYTDRGIPVMIAWNPEGRDWSHASVVFDVEDDGTVHVADPNIPDPDEVVRVLSKKDFYSKWSEKWPSYIVRRPAMAVEREVTEDGRQVMASKKANYRRWVQQVPGAVGNEALERAIGLLDELARQEGFLSVDIDGALSELFFDLGSQGRPFPKPNHWSLLLAKALRFNAKAEYQAARGGDKTAGLEGLDDVLASLEDQVGIDTDLEELHRMATASEEPERFAEMAEEAVANNQARIDHAKNQSSNQNLTKRARTVWAGSGLYGYTKAVQRDCEGCVKKLQRTASKLAHEIYRKDARTAAFLKTHAERADSTSARAILAAMSEIGPKLDTDTPKLAAARRVGLYGYPHKVARLCLDACHTLRDEAGSLTNDLHGRRTDRYDDIAGYFEAHAKEANCPYAGMLHKLYFFHSKKGSTIPTSVDDWIHFGS